MQFAVKFIHRFEDFALIGALVTMLAIALMQIVLRNFFDSGVLWAETFSRVLVLWLAMLGAMVATREQNHINIDVLSRYLPAIALKITRLMTSLAAAAICATASYYCYQFVLFEYEDATIAFATVPNWLCQSIIPLGFGVMSLRFTLQFFYLLRF